MLQNNVDIGIGTTGISLGYFVYFALTDSILEIAHVYRYEQLNLGAGCYGQ